MSYFCLKTISFIIVTFVEHCLLTKSPLEIYFHLVFTVYYKFHIHNFLHLNVSFLHVLEKNLLNYKFCHKCHIYFCLQWVIYDLILYGNQEFVHQRKIFRRNHICTIAFSDPSLVWANWKIKKEIDQIIGFKWFRINQIRYYFWHVSFRLLFAGL